MNSSTHKFKNIHNQKNDVIALYNEASRDYKFWSKNYNMHFGYYIPFKTNPFKRDNMLNEMNRQVLNKIINSSKKQLFIDLGCGMGGTIRFGLNHYNNLKMIGVTLSEFQVSNGNKLLKDINGLILNEDYENLSFKTSSLDGAIAIESLSHSGHSTASFKEAFRVLKPNSKSIIADAFLKKPKSDLCFVSKLCYKKLCEGWELVELGFIEDVKNRLKSVGFKNIVIKDLSFRVAPSVLHVPFAITGFILKKLSHYNTINKQSIKNLKGSIFALLSGLHMKSFGYYMIIATK